MTREEAIKAIKEASEYFGLLPSEFWYDGKYPIGEAIDMAIEALKGGDAEMNPIPNGTGVMQVTPSEDGSDLISRADAIEAVLGLAQLNGRVPTDSVIFQIKALPSADRPSGEWTEKEVMVDEDTNITEWQSARCSVCGKYHTTPYMYYFDNFNYCPNCGARMENTK